MPKKPNGKSNPVDLVAKKPWTGSLLKPIDLCAAKPRGLRAAFALPPDEDDIAQHLKDEMHRRWSKIDERFGLESGSPDIWMHRAKALVYYHVFEILPNDTNWWGRFAICLACSYVPGYSIKRPGAKKHGAPLEWTTQQLCELFSDIEYLKRKTRMSIRKICETLPRTKGYAPRWGCYTGSALRKAYSKAKKNRQFLLFELELCGPDATIVANGIDAIKAAIERHALRI